MGFVDSMYLRWRETESDVLDIYMIHIRITIIELGEKECAILKAG